LEGKLAMKRFAMIITLLISGIVSSAQVKHGSDPHASFPDSLFGTPDSPQRYECRSKSGALVTIDNKGSWGGERHVFVAVYHDAHKDEGASVIENGGQMWFDTLTETNHSVWPYQWFGFRAMNDGMNPFHQDQSSYLWTTSSSDFKLRVVNDSHGEYSWDGTCKPRR
jgi:hypothetical protein